MNLSGGPIFAALFVFCFVRLFWGAFFAPFCFSPGKKETTHPRGDKGPQSAGKKERSDEYVERKQDP